MYLFDAFGESAVQGISSFNLLEFGRSEPSYTESSVVKVRF